MIIRSATLEDLAAISNVEAACFPANEAATPKAFKERLHVYPNHFWLLEDKGKLVSFINGMVTCELTINDEMFENATLHNENGDWQAIFGVNTVLEYRGRGCAGMVMRRVIQDAKVQGRKGCILTCKHELVSLYAKFGFECIGKSKSVRGYATWFDMKLEF
jgi:ribosomal protein S18 acetylase RimI-like enzyme